MLQPHGLAHVFVERLPFPPHPWELAGPHKDGPKGHLILGGNRYRGIVPNKRTVFGDAPNEHFKSDLDENRQDQVLNPRPLVGEKRALHRILSLAAIAPVKMSSGLGQGNRPLGG